MHSGPTPPSARDPVWDPSRWLPTTRDELDALGWDCVDVIIVTGDAYVDHPAFGAAVVGRLIEREGLRVAVVPQPNWRDDLRDFRKLGAPRLFFGVTSGCMDSMVNRYTAAKKLRSEDAYTPGGEHGFRPDYATTAYSRILKQLFPEVPVLLGGIEASLRRVTHYDYWSDTIRPGILAESGADLLVYGMGELPLLEILRLLKRGVPFASLRTIAQTAVLLPPGAPTPRNQNWENITLHSHEECLADRALYASNFRDIETESNRVKARRLLQQTGDRTLLVNPPFPTMTEQQIDSSWDLPYTRLPHPRYRRRGPIPAYEMIKHSITLHRGCFGGCSFCTISAHQGKFVASRSKESILREVESIKRMPDFHGTISDLGGPSANMYKMKGKEQWICDECVRPSCIWPDVCRNLDTDHTPLLDIYRRVRETEGVKHAFVTSGLRYDLFLHRHASPEAKKSHERYVDELVEHHVSGRLKVAPEHTSDARAAGHAQADLQLLLPLQGEVRRRQGEIREDAAADHSVFHQLPPGLEARGHGRPRPEDEGPRVQARAGAGLHAHADDRRHGDLCHGRAPLRPEAGRRGEDPRREAGAAKLLLLVQARDARRAARDAKAGSGYQARLRSCSATGTLPRSERINRTGRVAPAFCGIRGDSSDLI